MTSNEDDTDSSVVASLLRSFRRVPSDSIPAVVDCLLASTTTSPATLFRSLIDSSPEFDEELSASEEWDSDYFKYLATFVSALCHLLKKLGQDHDSMNSFIWRTFLPLMKVLHTFNCELLNQVAELFTNVVVETNSWKVVEENMVPFLLRSVYHSLELEDEGFETSIGGLLRVYNDHFESLTWSLPVPISCHILALMLDEALSNKKIVGLLESMASSGSQDAQHFSGNLIWSLCNMAEHMLPQSSEHRSCAIRFLLPIILKAFGSCRSFEIFVHDQKFVLPRNDFFMKIWKCCKALFSLGNMEKRDAYGVLSLYLSFLQQADTDIVDDNIEGLNITNEHEFWDEIRKGLIDKESLVRKQSLHILKIAVHMTGGCLSNGMSEEMPHNEHWTPQSMTKKEAWAEKEAKSLGVGKICSPVELTLNNKQKWEAFVLLYEMLEEYGTHLVQAAWNHQVSLLIESTSQVHFASSNGVKHRNQLETPNELFNWLAILWERGLHHDNPQVRCLIMQSILDIKWENYGNFANSVPETFILESFLRALNDPTQHKEFGLRGAYSSTTIEGAARFLHLYANCLDLRKRVSFLNKLASSAKKQSYSRPGLISLAECIASASSDEHSFANGSDLVPQSEKILLLDAFRFVIDSSKQHFNPSYRLRVCERLLKSCAAVVSSVDMPLETLLHFISTFPQEFTDFQGSLRAPIQDWLMGYGKIHSNSGSKILENLNEFPSRFVSLQVVGNACCTYDDEDLDVWESEARRWARLLFLVFNDESHLIPLWTFIQNRGANMCCQNRNSDYVPVKFLILALSLLHELQIMQERSTEYGSKFRTKSQYGALQSIDKSNSVHSSSSLYQKLSDIFLSFMEELVSFADFSCSIFSSSINVDDTVPNSVKGKLGGPSQRRLPSHTTTEVLEAIQSVKTVALLLSWCRQFERGNSIDSAFKFLWKFYWDTVSSTSNDSEIGSEIRVAAYEALSFALKGLASSFSPQTLDYFRDNDKQFQSEIGLKPMFDFVALTFLQNVNELLGNGVLVRSRRAVLMNWKWHCLESLLSLPAYAVKNGVHLEGHDSFFSYTALRHIFRDLVENLENAGEGSVLPMLRSVRLCLDLFAEGKSGTIVSSCNGVELQMIWSLVRCSWILHKSCNKRKVAPIAALLSSVLHSSLFADESMHTTDNEPGPLKWFVKNIMEEGTKSPRTIRLAALHLTGMWLSNPPFIKYYVKELKLLSLYGSVAFDEDFEGELADNRDTRAEVSLLAKSPDPELSEAFINTELYARVSVAALFYKLAKLSYVERSSYEQGLAGLESGKLFLLELLDAAVNDNDLAKELYKKYSAIHRRKIRAWQMICVLSPFVSEDIAGKVTDYLHLTLSRNNLPAVRQYLETFAINIYLMFPALVVEQLVPILRDYDMRPQALSSYVFISANVILHACEEFQLKHLDELLPPIIPLLTSHHHSLRGFTQLLVYQVLFRFFPLSDLQAGATVPIEKRCFEDLKEYLDKNSDCTRLRASMEGFLDAYNPVTSVTPAGIFINRVEELEFECVPKSLMEEVLNFLNDVREDLRSSIAKDSVSIRNESLRSNNIHDIVGVSPNDNDAKSLMDFQKKITLDKHEKQGGDDICKKLFEIEKEDQLVEHLWKSRSQAMANFKTSRQEFIMVASLVDRIPNLAGLARTCEVFKASCLIVPDASIVHDKQFQLISVTADKWVPILEVTVDSLKVFLEKKKKEGYSLLGLEQTANSELLDRYSFPKKTVMVLGREKEGIPVDIIHILDACIEIPQLGVVRSLNVHVSGAIALWEYTRQHRSS